MNTKTFVILRAAEAIDAFVTAAQTADDPNQELPPIFRAQARDAFGALCRLMPRPTRFEVYALEMGRRQIFPFNDLHVAQAKAKALVDEFDPRHVLIRAVGREDDVDVSWTIEVWK